MTTKTNNMTTRQLADAILNMQNVLVGLQSQIATLTQSQAIVGDTVRNTRKNNAARNANNHRIDCDCSTCIRSENEAAAAYETAMTEEWPRKRNNHRYDCECGTCKRIEANKARKHADNADVVERFDMSRNTAPKTTSPKRSARKSAAVSFDPIFETLVPAVKAAQTRNYRNVNISALFKGDVRVFLPSRFNRAFRNWYRANDVHRIDAAKMLVEAMKTL